MSTTTTPPPTASTSYLSPLTPEQLRNIITLKNVYSEFWESVKFSKGWDSPVADIGDVLHLLEETAEIVVRVRAYLDSLNPAPKFRILDGNSKEYLWNLEIMPKEDRFVSELVHATLQHSGRYVEGLTKDEVDRFIKEIQAYTSEHQADKLAIEGNDLEDKILKLWNETDVLLKVTCAENAKFWNASLIKDAQQLLNQVNTIRQRLTLIQKKRDFNTKRQDKSSPRTTEQATTTSTTIKTTPVVEETPELSQQAKEEKEKKEAELLEKERIEAEERETKQKDREGMIKISLVAKDTQEIEEELKEISNIAGSLTKTKEVRPIDAMDKISDLKKRCLKNSSKLMQDLLSLDELVGLHESRAAKKEEVARIQHLLDNVENIKSKLNSLEVEIKPRASQQQKEEELDKIAEEELQHLVEQTKQEKKLPTLQPQQPKTTQQHAPEKIHVEKKPSTEKSTVPHVPEPEAPKKTGATLAHPRFDLQSAWNRLRLDPKMETHETADDYIIMANIPGIHKDEIETTVLPDGTLQISGVRVPSEQEINIMKRQIQSRYTPQSAEEEDMLLLKLGVGRFGRFAKKYQLPKGLDIDAIQGQYKDGILLIRIPKPKIQPVPRSRQREIPSSYGYPFYPYMNDVPLWGNRF